MPKTFGFGQKKRYKKLRGRHAKKEEDQNAEQTRNLTPDPDLDLDLGSEENVAQTRTERGLMPPTPASSNSDADQR